MAVETISLPISMKVILAGFGFNITTPGMKTNYTSAVLPTALPDSASMHACMYMCVRARVCVAERACVRATDGQGMERWWI